MIEPTQNIFDGLPERLDAERVEDLVSAPGLRVERIVSTGQASPPGFWYDQDWGEWVMVLSGSAGLRVAGEAEPRRLGAGDHVGIPAPVRHRGEWTDLGRAAVWLAGAFLIQPGAGWTALGPDP